MAKDKMGVDDTEMGSFGARDGDEKGYMNNEEGTGTAGDVTMDPDMEADLDTDTS